MQPAFVWGKNEEILIKGKEVEITRKQFMKALQRMDEMKQNAFLKKKERVYKAVKNYYLTQVAVHQAKQSGVYNTPRMQATIEKAIGDTVMREMYRLYLENNPLPDFTSLAREYYQVNKDLYKIPEQIKASHILIDSRKKNKDEARQLAEKIHQEVLTGNEFSELADKYSDDPRVSESHGDLGYFDRKRVEQPFGDAAFALQKIGDISPIVETENSFYIIKLEGKKASSYKSYDEVKNQIIKKLQIQEDARRRVQFKNKLVDLENTEVNTDAIDALVVKPTSYEEIVKKQKEMENKKD